MRRIYPDIQDNPDIAQAYAYPAERPWLRLNMVASADGAAWLDGRSGGLSSKGDKRIFQTLRGLADVIVAGAATVRKESYGPVPPRDWWAELRVGRPTVPPIAVISRSLALDLDGPLFTDAPSRTIVITCDDAPLDRRELAAERSDLIVAGDDCVDMKLAVAALHERGLTRVLCEGGPRINAQLSACDLVDELCLSISPVLVGGDAARIQNGELAKVPLQLTQVLEEEGVLFCTYTRERSDDRTDATGHGGAV
ncbi:Pyrimidine reductase, riboflavin biosynthesis [Nonomuraea maritima]|uniref:Pyrimidine reductase, riboflavin biosynthesis n=1 Tax=Nonomuraea maritima TaxID=683260 RepID=A0A1G9G4T6_9ACTN|nr:pyrimidine reductase family protein [Nonomuraea maritima]SDK95602.1 Pyrimidine reductase, riboflavin biosynthesis [Nonomuraea maritima]